jgi:hypothetical protein
MGKSRRANRYSKNAHLRRPRDQGDDVEPQDMPQELHDDDDGDQDEVKSVGSTTSTETVVEGERLAEQAGEFFGMCVAYLVTALCGLFRRSVSADLKVTLDMIDRVKCAGLAAATFIVALWVQHTLSTKSYSDALIIVGVSTSVLWFLIERMAPQQPQAQDRK